MSRAEGGRRDDLVRKMAEMMMKGATMLEQTCPLDGLPLFRLRSGDIVCPVHGKVLIVSDEQEAREVELEGIIRSVQYMAAQRVKESMDKGDPVAVKQWLDVIEAVERIKKLRREQGSEGRGGGEGKS